MQLGFVSAILPDLTFDEVCATAAAEGYDCVEIMCWPVGKAERRYAGVTHIDVNRLDAGEVRSIRATLDKHGVGVSALGYYPNPLSPNPNEAATAAAHVEQVIRAAKKLGLARVNTFVGRDWTRSLEANWQRFWKPGSRSSAAPKNTACASASRTARCSSPPTNGPAERIWRSRRRSGAGCSAQFRASASASTTTPRISPGCRWTPSRRCATSPSASSTSTPKTCGWTAAASTTWAFSRIHWSFTSPSCPASATSIGAGFFSVLTSSGYDGPVCIEVEDRAYEGSLEARKRALRQGARFLRQFVV